MLPISSRPGVRGLVLVRQLHCMVIMIVIRGARTFPSYFSDVTHEILFIHRPRIWLGVYLEAALHRILLRWMERPSGHIEVHRALTY
ncbi:hypothetical protein K438DRAFT_775952 [Mycena galopus ATCC 62051]|nr:hypothetical protein K438DRAFT_775952 [Mycena galopus ATCC 62051]